MMAAGFSIEKLSYANTLLFPLVWAGRAVQRIRGRIASENDLHPAWSNDLLASVFAAERRILRLANFPFGVSLLGIGVRS